ncbi:MAG: hypothetical protein HQK54_03525 [Oligoflexales bacterium]|nr:hypothetical protein [Oligoflexales bacterium]
MERLEHEDFYKKLTDISQAKTFLGREFLAWLWFQMETNTEPTPIIVTNPKKTLSVSFWIDDRIVLESLSNNSSLTHLIKGNNASRSLEATAALKSGKSIKEVKLGVNIDTIGEYTAILSCKDLSPKSLKLPPFPEDLSNEDTDISKIDSRISQTEIFLQVLDCMFSTFLDLRIDDSWTDDILEKIRSWIKKRHTREIHLLH